MSLNGIQYSYAAGSTSQDPHGYRVVSPRDANRLGQILTTFPILRQFLNSSALYINSYPATLGLATLGPLVDTYLHRPTFIRAMRLAVCERRHVVLTSQPLVGADQVFHACRSEREIPRSMLWIVGGYYLPISLESSLRYELASRGCELTCLYSYGVAEIGHSCFAAMERLDCGVPRFKKIADEVGAEINMNSNVLSLTSPSGRRVETGDFAERVEGDWAIESGPMRLDPEVRKEIESWPYETWRRRTGYLLAQESSMSFQLRERVSGVSHQSETEHHEFLARFGGSFSCKPKWNMQPS